MQHQLGPVADPAEYEIPKVPVLLAPGADVPAVAGVHHGVRLDHPELRLRVRQRRVFDLHSLAFPAGLQHRPQHRRTQIPGRGQQHLGVELAHRQRLKGTGQVLPGVHHLQVLVGDALGEHRLERLRGAVALEEAVIRQIVRPVIRQIGIDVLAGLLPPDAEGTHQMISGEPALPECHHLDQPVSQ